MPISSAEIRKLAADNGIETHPIVAPLINAFDEATQKASDAERKQLAAEARAEKAETALAVRQRPPSKLIALCAVLGLSLAGSLAFIISERSEWAAAERNLSAAKIELVQAQSTVNTLQTTLTDQRKASVDVTANIDRLTKKYEDTKEALLEANHELRLENEKLKDEIARLKQTSPETHP